MVCLRCLVHRMVFCSCLRTQTDEGEPDVDWQEVYRKQNHDLQLESPRSIHSRLRSLSNSTGPRASTEFEENVVVGNELLVQARRLLCIRESTSGTKIPVVSHDQLAAIMSKRPGWMVKPSSKSGSYSGWITFQHFHKNKCDAKTRLPWPNLRVAPAEVLEAFMKVVNDHHQDKVFEVLSFYELADGSLEQLECCSFRQSASFSSLCSSAFSVPLSQTSSSNSGQTTQLQ